MELKAGVRLQSAVSEAEVIVVRAPSEPVTLTCGGVPLVAAGEAPASGTPAAALDDQIQLGKRYVDEPSGTELLCTKAGAGSLGADDRVMTLKTAKPLPSSD
jgi:hypothetical protein